MASHPRLPQPDPVLDETAQPPLEEPLPPPSASAPASRFDEPSVEAKQYVFAHS
jgi:hypothetical protein